jgi:hypothetical protein
MSTSRSPAPYKSPLTSLCNHKKLSSLQLVQRTFFCLRVNDAVVAVAKIGVALPEMENCGSLLNLSPHIPIYTISRHCVSSTPSPFTHEQATLSTLNSSYRRQGFGKGHTVFIATSKVHSVLLNPLRGTAWIDSAERSTLTKDLRKPATDHLARQTDSLGFRQIIRDLKVSGWDHQSLIFQDWVVQTSSKSD